MFFNNLRIFWPSKILLITLDQVQLKSVHAKFHADRTKSQGVWKSSFAYEETSGLQLKRDFVCSQPRPTLPPVFPMQKPLWAFRPRVPQQSTRLPSCYWTDVPCRSPTKTLKETKLQDLLTPRKKQAERLHTAGSTHVRTSWCLKFWLLSKVLTSVL